MGISVIGDKMEEKNMDLIGVENTVIEPVQPIVEQSVASVMEQPVETVQYVEQPAVSVMEQPVETVQYVEQPVAPVMEQPVETVQYVEQPVAPVMEKPVETMVEPKQDIKVSGTASEEEINSALNAKPVELLDEDEMKKAVSEEKNKTKKNTVFIVIIFALIIIFVFLMPYIIKMIGY